MIRSLILYFGVLLFSIGARAQHLSVGYYDLDGLYDTIPSRFYDDSEYTPEGSLHWTRERYEHKIRNIAKVIDSMALDVVGLYGVEHQGVVADIAKACAEDYTYIHSTRNSFDGQDFAVLYFGDKIYIEGFDDVVSGRNILALKTKYFDDNPIMIIFSRSGDETIDLLSEEQPEGLVVVMGMIRGAEIDAMGYTNTLLPRERLGEGNYSSFRGWVMHDRVATNQDYKILKSGVYLTPWLLHEDMKSPLPTYDRYNYIGGYSKYLPIFTYIYL